VRSRYNVVSCDAARLCATRSNTGWHWRWSIRWPARRLAVAQLAGAQVRRAAGYGAAALAARGPGQSGDGVARSLDRKRTSAHRRRCVPLHRAPAGGLRAISANQQDAIWATGSATKASSISKGPQTRIWRSVCHRAPGQLGVERFRACLDGRAHDVVIRPLDNPKIDALVERYRRAFRQPVDRQERIRARHPESPASTMRR
jgi:hypothetical protein